MITEPFISYVNVYRVKIMLKFVDVRLADFCYQPLDNTEWMVVIKKADNADNANTANYSCEVDEERICKTYIVIEHEIAWHRPMPNINRD